jgi:hypothetical protein
VSFAFTRHPHNAPQDAKEFRDDPRRDDPGLGRRACRVCRKVRKAAFEKVDGACRADERVAGQDGQTGPRRSECSHEIVCVCVCVREREREREINLRPCLTWLSDERCAIIEGQA